LNRLLDKYFKNSARNSRIVLLLMSILLLFLAYNASQLKFDYDFEKFFPEENEDLRFYQAYRQSFENDNDFILIAVKSKKGLLDPDFLKDVESFSNSLRALPHIRELISPLDLKKLSIRPGSIVPMQRAYLSPERSSYSKKDSLLLTDPNEPISSFLSFEDNSLVLILKNIQMISKKKSDELAIRMNQLRENHPFSEVYMIGKILGQKSYIDILKREFLTFMIISIIIVIILLWMSYRSLWGIAIPLMTVLLAIIGSLGIMQLSGTYLNMMTTLLPVIMLVVGMSDVVHLISKYVEELKKGNSKIPALKFMVKRVGMATLLTSLTTALGFITLIGVKMKPVQSFGVFTAVGVVLAFILAIAFITSIFVLVPVPKISYQRTYKIEWEEKLASLFNFLLKHRIKVISIYLLISVLALFGASRVKFDYFLMQDLGKDHPLMVEGRYFEQFGGIRPFEMAILPKNELKITDHEVMLEMEKIVAYLSSDMKVEQIVSPVYPIQYFNKTLRGDKKEYFKIPASKKRYEYLLDNVMGSDLAKDLTELMDEERNIARIFGRMVDPGSMAMLERQAKLEEFFEANIDENLIQYQLTGTPVIIDKGGRQISRTIILGLLTAFALIALSMGILFRSVKMAFLSLVPNVFPILLTAGFIGFANIDLNMTTAIVFTIAFGIAVDDTIHFLSRYHQELKAGRSNFLAVRRTFISTGKAIVLTTIILLGGFVSLLFSDFQSTFYIGLFVSMTLIFALITDLSLLPLLLLKKEKKA